MEERSNHFDGMSSPSSTLEFQQCLNATELMGLYNIGPLFTLTNKRTMGFVAKKLDIG